MVVAPLAVPRPAGAVATVPDPNLAGPPGGGALPSQALYAWGSNDWGQLALGTSGDGTPTPETKPVAVTAPAQTAYRSVAAGGAHSLGLTTAGRVYAWGANFSGQLGVGSLDPATRPEAVAVPGTVVAVAAGSSHSLALTSTGSVYAWGANLFGQLGDGTTTGSDLPVRVAIPTGVTVTAIAAGGDHSLALTSTGSVYAWGANLFGQLGDGTTVSRDTPVAVPAPGGVVITAVAAGTGHSLALASTGSVYAWGFNASGQLGDGTTVNRTAMTAVHLPDGAAVATIAAGEAHSLAVTTTGAVLAWGSNVFGQLDSALVASLPVDSPLPLQPLGLPPLTTFVAVAAGIDSSYAVTSTGVVWVWGGDAYGQLGTGTSGLDGVLPLPLATLPLGTLATGVFAGADASAAFLVTRSTQTIAFPALPAPTYGDPPVDVAPVSTAGLPLTKSASGSCAGSLSHLQLVGAGRCTISASQPGSFWFYPAAASASFEVARASLAVDPEPVTATVGAPPSSFSYRLVGFKNRDPASVVTGRASCRSTATGFSLQGRYAITCTPGSLSAANYDFVPGPPAVLTLIARASGYAMVATDGSLWALGPAQAASAPVPPFFGSMSGRPLNAPVVGAAFTPRHDGYWLVASDGGIFTFGSAGFHGSMGGTPLNRPIVGLAATPDGGGYWEVAADGGVFAFGDAGFFGSTGGIALNRPIVGMAASPGGEGYWLVASDGGIFAFGAARFMGSTGALALAQPVVGVAATPSGDGYWITTSSGIVFHFGRAPFEGSLRYVQLASPVVGLVSTYDGQGYWLASADGGVFAFGDAGYFGRAVGPPAPIDGII